jgi:hypothetical protein
MPSVKPQRHAPQAAEVWDHIRLVYVTGKIELDAHGKVQRVVPQSYEEIAEDFGVSPRAVRAHAQRGGWAKLRTTWRYASVWARREMLFAEFPVPAEDRS